MRIKRKRYFMYVSLANELLAKSYKLQATSYELHNCRPVVCKRGCIPSGMCLEEAVEHVHTYSFCKVSKKFAVFGYRFSVFLLRHQGPRL